MSKRISNQKKNQVILALKRNILPPAVARDLNVPLHKVYYIKSKMNKGEIKTPRGRPIKEKVEIIKPTRPSLTSSDPKEKLNALIYHLGKEALKKLLDE